MKWENTLTIKEIIEDRRKIIQLTGSLCAEWPGAMMQNTPINIFQFSSPDIQNKRLWWAIAYEGDSRRLKMSYGVTEHWEWIQDQWDNRKKCWKEWQQCMGQFVNQWGKRLTEIIEGKILTSKNMIGKNALRDYWGENINIEEYDGENTLGNYWRENINIAEYDGKNALGNYREENNNIGKMTGNNVLRNYWRENNNIGIYGGEKCLTNLLKGNYYHRRMCFVTEE